MPIFRKTRKSGGLRTNTLAKNLRPIPKKDALVDFKKLQERAKTCGPFKPQERSGLRTLNSLFFKHRLRAPGKSGVTFPETLADPARLDYIEKKLAKIKKHQPQNELRHLRQLYDVFQLYFGAVNQFRPTEALKIYCELRPQYGILDFSSGWGGRCIAALAAGIPYYGCDANERMRKSYESLVKIAEEAGAEPNVHMIFQPSETVKDFKAEIAGGAKYDLVFTSPPYFTLEKYEGMPKYAGKEGFLTEFLGPVVERSWKGLELGGYMALNMPSFMYDAVKDSLPPLWGKRKLGIAARHGSDAGAGRAITKKSEKKAFEWIYIWKKDRT
ncbi:MAG: hypothetical protein EB120_11095 [Proteobacteria bacterium]|nr:hypothetical protein [Pseudomonadota bacterium]